jgi:hypothetical protein
VIPDQLEENVFTLERVRQHRFAQVFPATFELSLFLLLSHPRAGTYSGRILVIDEPTDKTVRYLKFDVTFDGDYELRPMYVDLGACRFDEAGLYRFQVWFSDQRGHDTLKGEQPFYVLETEE